MFLNCHTYYSLRFGTLKISELLAFGQRTGATAMALTDINSTSASLEFVRVAPEFKIKPILGVDFRKGAQQQFVMLAENNKGFQYINEYLSGFLHERKGTEKLKIPARAQQFPHTLIIYPFTSFTGKTLLENEFLGVKMEDINRLKFSPWKDKQEKLVVLHTVSFQNKKGFNTHRLLRAIDNNTLLSKLPVSEQGSEADVFVSEEILKKSFAEFPKLIENTEHLLKRCHVHFDFSKKTTCNQKSYTANENLDFRLLKKLAYAGLP